MTQDYRSRINGGIGSVANIKMTRFLNKEEQRIFHNAMKNSAKILKDAPMTPDYRKRAEEFIIKPWDPRWVEDADVTDLMAAFQQVAQEARREENEACAQAAENSCSQLTVNYNAKVWEVSKTAVRVAAKAIRSRMEGK